MSNEFTNQFTPRPAATVQSWNPIQGFLNNIPNPFVPAHGFKDTREGQTTYFETFTGLGGGQQTRPITDPGKTRSWFGADPNAPALQAQRAKDDEQKAEAKAQAKALLERNQRQQQIENELKRLQEARLGYTDANNNAVNRANVKVNAYTAGTGRMTGLGDTAARLLDAQGNVIAQKVNSFVALDQADLNRSKFDYEKQTTAYNNYVARMQEYGNLQNQQYHETMDRFAKGAGYAAMAITGRVPPI
jgi:hypothetical protein